MGLNILSLKLFLQQPTQYGMPNSKCNRTHPQYPAVKQAVQTLLLSIHSCTLKYFEEQYSKLAALFVGDSLHNQLYRTKLKVLKELNQKGVKLSDKQEKQGLKRSNKDSTTESKDKKAKQSEPTFSKFFRSCKPIVNNYFH